MCEGVEATYKVDLRRDLIPPQLLLATINGFSDVRVGGLRGSNHWKITIITTKVRNEIEPNAFSGRVS